MQVLLWLIWEEKDDFDMLRYDEKVSCMFRVDLQVERWGKLD